MKRIFVNIWIIVGLLLVVNSCDTDEIGFYKEGYDAVRFPATSLEVSEPVGYNGESRLFLAAISFIDSPFASDTVYQLPVVLIGRTASVDRTISYRIDEEKTNAPTGSFDILEAVYLPIQQSDTFMYS